MSPASSSYLNRASFFAFFPFELIKTHHFSHVLHLSFLKNGQKNKPLKNQGFKAANRGIRTPDLRITSASLYRLSHISKLINYTTYFS